MTDTKIYRKKSNGRYQEIGTCDVDAYYYPHGAHLVVAKPGSTLTRHNVNPDHAAVDAALERVRDAMADAMRGCDVMLPSSRAYTATERKAWAAYVAIAGEPKNLSLEGMSMYDVVDAAIKVLKAEVLL